MKIRITTFFIILITVFLLVGCGIKKKAKENIESVSIETEEKIKMLKDKLGKDVLKVVVSLPKVPNKYKFITEKVNSNYDSYIDNIEQELLPDAIENLEFVHDKERVFEVKRDFEVLRNNEGVLSVKLQDYRYIGGAHGSKFIQALNFDINDRKLIKMDDLFIVNKEKYEGIVLKLIEKEIEKIKKEGKVTFFDDYVDTLSLALEDDRFVLTDEGVGFIYQEYDIASYAEGPQVIVIPYELMSDIINIKYVKTK